MDWTYGWLLSGCAAFILASANLIRAALRKRQRWQLFLFASLSCGGLSLLCALQMVREYVEGWLVASLLDVVPALAGVSTAAACLGIVLNFLALWLHLRQEGRGCRSL